MVTGSKRWEAPVAALACVLLCVSCAAFRESGRATPAACDLEYAPIEDDSKIFDYLGSNSLDMGARSRNALEGQPVYFSKRPQYGSLALGGLDAKDNKGKTFTFVVDESKGTGTGYDTLYLDANADGSLEVDAKVTGKPRTYTRDGKEVEDWRYIDFPPVELQLAYGDKTYPFHVRPWCNTYSQTSMRISSRGYCKGELTLDGTAYPIALVDDTCNGRFNDPVIAEGGGTKGNIYARGDALVIDVNKDGKFEKDYTLTPELYPLGKLLVFGGVCYDMEVSPCGRHVALKPTETACGAVTLSQTDCEVVLYGKSGALKLDGNMPRTKVPVGEYRFAGCRFERTSASGKTKWTLVGSGDWAQPVVNVTEKGKTCISFGPPIVMTVEVSKQDTSQFRFDLAMKGQGGETYVAGNLARNGKEIKNAPAFQVLNPEGKVVARGTFEYG